MQALHDHFGIEEDAGDGGGDDDDGDKQIWQVGF